MTIYSDVDIRAMILSSNVPYDLTFYVSELLIFVAFGIITILANKHNDTYWKNDNQVCSPNDHTPVKTKTNTTFYNNKTYT